MKNLCNLDVRMDMLRDGITIKELATAVGLTREWTGKLLSRPLSADNRLRIYDALARIRSGSVPGEADHGSGS